MFKSFPFCSKELPEPKHTETTFGKQMYSMVYPKKPVPTPLQAQARPSSRHKRHADNMASTKPLSFTERKPRKRRTIEKVGASVVSIYYIYQVISLLLFYVPLHQWFCS